MPNAQTSFLKPGRSWGFCSSLCSSEALPWLHALLRLFFISFKDFSHVSICLQGKYPTRRSPPTLLGLCCLARRVWAELVHHHQRLKIISLVVNEVWERLSATSLLFSSEQSVKGQAHVHVLSRWSDSAPGAPWISSLLPPHPSDPLHQTPAQAYRAENKWRRHSSSQPCLSSPWSDTRCQRATIPLPQTASDYETSHHVTGFLLLLPLFFSPANTSEGFLPGLMIKKQGSSQWGITRSSS